MIPITEIHPCWSNFPIVIWLGAQVIAVDVLLRY
jgi:hypothetical protein